MRNLRPRSCGLLHLRGWSRCLQQRRLRLLPRCPKWRGEGQVVAPGQTTQVQHSRARARQRQRPQLQQRKRKRGHGKRQIPHARQQSPRGSSRLYR